METKSLYRYPKVAAFGRVLPKTKIYEHADPATAAKNLIVSQVQRIIWAYKLAPETVNLKATPGVPEIQVFQVDLKGKELSHDVLRTIDRAIPFPIVFELRRDNEVKMAVALKQLVGSAGGKSAPSSYFESAWSAEDVERVNLPVSLDLAQLYAQIIVGLLPYSARPGETLFMSVERMNAIRVKERETLLLESKLRKERQFNRKVEINRLLRLARANLDELTAVSVP